MGAYYYQMYSQRVQGFTTIKFFLACSLIATILYSLYLIYDLWGVEESFVRKTICFLTALSASAVMYIINSLSVIRQFLKGASKYNRIRTLPELKSTQPQVAKTKTPRQSKILQQTPADPHHSKIKKHYSYSPADLQSIPTNPKEPDTKGRKVLRSLSSPMSTSSDDTDIYTFQLKQKNNELNYFLNLYENQLKNEGKDILAQKLKISKAKGVLGTIFKNQAIKQENQKKQLIEKLEILFDIHIVANRKKLGFYSFQERMDSLNQDDKNKKILVDRNREVVLDEILEEYANGSLGRTGFKLRNRAAEDMEFRSRMSSTILKLANERLKLDKQINFNAEFPNDKARQIAIDKLKEISSHYLENKNLTINSSMDQFETARLMVWVLSKHINQLVRIPAEECLIFLQQDSTDGERKTYIRWIPSKTGALPHFNQVVETTQNEGARSKIEFACAPSPDNIGSLFVSYLTYLEREFKAQLILVPTVEGYANDTLGTFV